MEEERGEMDCLGVEVGERGGMIENE